ncbi:hypothetical protein JTE90_008587 [Oedothorax gibbosus]|uniref:Angio-associated migratory cell protein n=1 Tax=Oedothorax gibbosus TaxID=931172 RepID=A0AAV6U8X8_9ARAC|nr:hypothetical protein JTE90_008587 [Oedothorax gibbosus]
MPISFPSHLDPEVVLLKSTSTLTFSKLLKIMPCNTPPPPELFDDTDDLIEDAPDDGFEIVYDEDITDMPEIDPEEVIDHAVVTFKGHQDPVFCCNFNNTGTLAVSGGQDDHAFVWDINTGETKFFCAGHTDSVIAVQFNYDSSMVATAGMDGLIQVWNVETGDKLWDYETSEITWMTWHTSENHLFAGTSDGTCWKWSVPDGETCGLFAAHGCSSTCAKLLDNGLKIAIGYFDGSIKIWDTNLYSVIATVTGKDAHTGDVTCMACSADDNLLVTGSVDGTAKLIKTSNCRVLHTWNCSVPEEEENEEGETVESVGFFNSHNLVATGTDCGNLRIFDISTYTQRAMVNIGSPIIKLICGATSPLVYIATTPFIELYDGRAAQLQKRWSGHTNSILDFVLSKEQDVIMSASDDHTCKIFRNS